ncbi:MAG: hypothetical protein KDD76_03480 [Rickettsiales bacterium]|nr:hypothetical protein [Rickettsiales bacterium]
MVKIAIIGAAGRTGADTIAELAAHHILESKDELVLVDIVARARGMIGETKTLFLNEGSSPKIIPVNGFDIEEQKQLENTDICIVCASIPFVTSEKFSRDHQLYKNKDIITYYAHVIGRYAPNALVIMDTNPLDVMAAHFLKESGLQDHQVMGKGGDLDTQRLCSFLARTIAKEVTNNQPGEVVGEIEYKVYRELVNASPQVSMLGVHDAAHMIPVVDNGLLVFGKPLGGESGWLTEEQIERAIENAKNVGSRTSTLLGNASPSKGGAHVNVALIQKLLSEDPQDALVSVPMRNKYSFGDTPAFSCTLCSISKRGVRAIHEVNEITQNPALLEKFQAGVQSIEGKLQKLQHYDEVREIISITPLEAIIDTEKNVAVLGYKTPQKRNTTALVKAAMAIGNLVTEPDKWQVTTCGNVVAVTYPDPMEIQRIFVDLAIESNIDIHKQIQSIQGQVLELSEKMSRLGMTPHQRG